MNSSPKQSSQCQWGEGPDQGLKLAESLEPVRKVAIITPGPHTAPVYGKRQDATLAQILESGVDIALSYPLNDSHDVILIQNGKIWLLLTPETYYKAGLEAKKHGSKYLATYDIKVPGKRLDRLKWVLQTTLTAVYTFFVTSAMPTGVEQTARCKDLLVPPLYPPGDADDAAGEAFADWANQFTEWAGLAAVSPQLLTSGEPVVDQAICDNYIPDDSELRSVASSITTGVYRSDQIRNIWSQLLSHEWAVMSVQGFDFMPVSRTGKPRERGEIGYTLIKNKRGVSFLRYTH